MSKPHLPETALGLDRVLQLERRVTTLERAARLPFSTIGSGGLAIRGGALNLYNASDDLLLVLDALGLTVREADGSTLSLLDGTKLRFNRSDGTRQLEITPAGGLRVYATDGSTVRTTLDSTGVQVGTDVVIDSAGLKIDGVLQPAIETLSSSTSFQNVSLTTSYATLATVVLTIPSFATVVDVNAFGRMQLANSSGAVQSFDAQVQVESEATDTARDYADNNLTSSVMSIRTDRITGSPSTVTTVLRGKVTSGTNSTNVGRLSVFAVARRVA